MSKTPARATLRLGLSRGGDRDRDTDQHQRDHRQCRSMSAVQDRHADQSSDDGGNDTEPLFDRADRRSSYLMFRTHEPDINGQAERVLTNACVTEGNGFSGAGSLSPGRTPAPLEC